MRTVRAGLLLATVVASVFGLLEGLASLRAAFALGLVATALQAAATRAVVPALQLPFSTFVRRWGVGIGLRLLGVALIPVAVLANPEAFPPLATAFGYLGVVVPLLFMEVRLVR